MVGWNLLEVNASTENKILNTRGLVLRNIGQRCPGLNIYSPFYCHCRGGSYSMLSDMPPCRDAITSILRVLRNDLWLGCVPKDHRNPSNGCLYMTKVPMVIDSEAPAPATTSNEARRRMKWCGDLILLCGILNIELGEFCRLAIKNMPPR